MPNDPTELEALALAQDGVATRRQIENAAVTRHAIDANLAARRWQALGPRVIILHNGPLTRRQQWWAAVLAAEEPAALASRTAAEDAGLVGWETDVVHLLVRRGARVTPVPGIPLKVHESRRFDAEDIHLARRPPQVRLERAVIDAAAWSTRPRTACGIVAASVQQRLARVPELSAALDAAGKVRHRRILEAALRDIEGGAHAVSEMDFLRFCRRHRFPRPRLQVRVDGGQRRRYLDAVFIRPDGREIGVEIDGGLHLVVATYWQDMSRLNDMVVGGRRTLRFPSAAIYADDPVAVAQLRSALGLRDVSDAHPAIAG